MILVGLGGNVSSPKHGNPKNTLTLALAKFAGYGVHLVAQSNWYVTQPFPMSEQPPFVNAVVSVHYSGTPIELLGILNKLEGSFGRVRGERWGPRAIDLDLLAFDECIVGWDRSTPDDTLKTMVVPHPRLHLRRFVLDPITDFASEWTHPVLGLKTWEMINNLPSGQVLEIYQGS